MAKKTTSILIRLSEDQLKQLDAIRHAQQFPPQRQTVAQQIFSTALAAQGEGKPRVSKQIR